MKLDIDTILKDMLAAIKRSVKDDWSEVKDVASQFLERRKDRLTLMAQLRLSGELSKEKFESRLADEKLIAEAELNAIAVVSKAMAQNAANAAFDVLNKAVKTALQAAL